MNTHQQDLFGNSPPVPIGMTVELDRGIDRAEPCCNNLAVVRPGRGPHGAALHCATCGRFRGWLSKLALEFLTATKIDAAASIVLRDSSITDGTTTMPTKQTKPEWR